jgi:hypothetical protein
MVSYWMLAVLEHIKRSLEVLALQFVKEKAENGRII